jgi:hypothetical protein
MVESSQISNGENKSAFSDRSKKITKIRFEEELL